MSDATPAQPAQMVGENRENYSSRLQQAAPPAPMRGIPSWIAHCVLPNGDARSGFDIK